MSTLAFRTAMHGPFTPHLARTIDPATILAFHRATFGDTRMEDAPAEPAAAPAAGDPAPAAAPAPAPKADDLPDWARDPATAARMVQEAKKEAADASAKARTAAKEHAAAEARQDLLKELGLVKDGDAPGDPVQLAADLKTETAKSSATALELAIYKAAIAAGAKPDALTDSRTFMEKAAAIDLTDKAALAAAVTEAVKNNPLLKAVQATGASSVDHAGGSGEGRHDLDAQIAEAEKAGNHTLAISLKRQRAYLPTST